jgi:phospholipid transport system transporter-binding protein
MVAIALPAVLTIGEARATLAQLQQAMAAEAAPVLDGSALKTLDSSAIAVLLDCQRQAAAAGKRLQLQGLPTKLVDLATLYGVDALIAQ